MKLAKRTPIVAFIIILCIGMSLYLSIEWLWPEFYGSRSLENNEYLFENKFDNIEATFGGHNSDFY